MNKHLCQKELKNRQRVILSVLLMFAIAPISNLCAAVSEQPAATAGQDSQQAIRVRVFTLRNITTQQTKDYLQSAKIADTILAIPGTNAISVTGNAEELVYATTVIKLVDANDKFDVRFLDIPPGKEAPVSGKIEKELGQGYSIGTLMDGPSGVGVIKAIVAPYKDKLLIIAPEEQSNKIAEAVQKTLVEKSEAEPNQQSLKTSSEQASSPQAVFTKEPIVIEPNATKTAAVSPEPNRPKAEDDDMLGGFINELTETAKPEKAKAEREAALAKAAAEKGAKAEAEKKQPAQIPAEEPATGQAEETIQDQTQKEPNAIQAEKQIEEKKQQAAKIKKKFSNKSQQTVLPAEQEQQELPGETDDIVPVPAELKVMPDVDIPNGDELLELNLPEKLDLVALIDLVGKYLNLNYLYDETKVTGSVTIKVQGRLRVRELYNLLESVLKFRGFAMSRKGRLVTIVPTAEALDQDPTFAERSKAGDVFTTSVFHLKYITTATAKKLLGEMKLGSSITEIPEIGTLVITEYSFRMQRIEDLLSLVDVPGPPREFKLRILNYTIAEVLVPKIQALAEQLGTVDVTVGTSAAQTPTPGVSPRIRRPQPVVQPQPQQPGEAATKKTGVFLDFDKRTNRILMIGLTNELAAVEQIIDTLDVPQQDLRVIREYEIQYVDIDKVVSALGEFGIIVVSGGGATIGPQTVIRPGPEQPQQPTVAPAIQTTTSPGGAQQALVSLDQPQVVKLESTNSLLINATPEQQIQIARIISYIDREPIEAAIPYRIYRLENQEPEALAEVLNNLIQKTVKDKEGKIQQTIKYTEENIAIVPDKNTFSLIVYASKKNQEWIGNLIKSLDRRRPQVLIDVSLVEITRDDDFNYDLSLVANAKRLVTGNLAVTGSQLLTTASGSHLEGGFDLTDSTGANLGAVKGFYSNDRIQALLTLIDKKSYGRILAKPKVLVNDNEQGDIVTTERTYVSSTTNVYPTATSGQTPVPVTTQVWTPYEAKIELKITPQISEGELLRLEIVMTREDFENLAKAKAAGSPPDYATSNVNTIVTVPDGSTIILGGLTKLNQTKAGSKVPLLGDIPVAGALFRTVSKVASDSKLYIFVKANILRPEQTIGLSQLKNISKSNKVEFERSESEFQKHQEFPGIKPEPLQPEKVLEQEVEEVNEPKVVSKK